jgi:predicted nucleic acid-binding protein
MKKVTSSNGFFSSLEEADLLYVPQLWWYEMGNDLKNAAARNRLEYTKALTLAADLPKFGVSTDSESGGPYTNTLLRLAHDYGITAYDAAYLELAALKHGVETL